MAKHKWNKEIKAWADGAIIQFKDANDINEWDDCVDNQPYWGDGNNMEYRIKPQPEYLYVFCDGNGNQLLRTHTGKNRHETYIGKIKLEVDDD